MAHNAHNAYASDGTEAPVPPKKSLTHHGAAGPPAVAAQQWRVGARVQLCSKLLRGQPRLSRRPTANQLRRLRIAAAIAAAAAAVSTAAAAAAITATGAAAGAALAGPDGAACVAAAACAASATAATAEAGAWQRDNRCRVDAALQRCCCDQIFTLIGFCKCQLHVF